MTLAIILLLCSGLASGGGIYLRQEGSPAESSAHEQAPPQPGQESQNAPTNSEIKPAPAPCPPSQQTCESTPPPQPAPQAGRSTAQPTPGSGTAPQQPRKAADRSGRAKRASKKNKNQTTPRKIIVRDGGTSEAPKELAPDMPSDQATHARQTTEQLLASTRDNLERAAARKLNLNQKNTVEQIKTFMDQCNVALKAGDLQRGHNLALKAHLLSDDLLK